MQYIDYITEIGFLSKKCQKQYDMAVFPGAQVRSDLGEI